MAPRVGGAVVFDRRYTAHTPSSAIGTTTVVVYVIGIMHFEKDGHILSLSAGSRAVPKLRSISRCSRPGSRG